MGAQMVRTHVVMPTALVEEVDRLVGRRRRSRFFAKAVEEKVARLKLSATARMAAGSLSDLDIPGWESSESAAEWVRASRRADEGRLADLLGK